MIPTLSTPRLTLRPMLAGDFPAYRAMLASARSVHMGGPYDERGAWGMFCHDIACWSLYGHGGLMVDLLATGECVGQVGINAGPLFPEKELGWLLYEGFEGRGYAPRRRSRCATGPLLSSAWKHSSATSTRPISAPSPWLNAWALIVTPRHWSRIRATWCSDTDGQPEFLQRSRRSWTFCAPV